MEITRDLRWTHTQPKVFNLLCNSGHHTLSSAVLRMYKALFDCIAQGNPFPLAEVTKVVCSFKFTYQFNVIGRILSITLAGYMMYRLGY